MIHILVRLQLMGAHDMTIGEGKRQCVGGNTRKMFRLRFRGNLRRGGGKDKGSDVGREEGIPVVAWLLLRTHNHVGHHS